jgi:penicillin-binding protein 1B
MQRKSSKHSPFQTAIFFSISIVVVGAVLMGASFVVSQLFWMGRQIDEVTWQLPATIYAEPPSLTSGRTGSTSWLVQYLKRLNYVENSSPEVEPGQYAFAKNGVIFRPRPLGNEETAPVLVTFSSNRVRSMVDLSTNIKLEQVSLEPTPLATLFGSEWEKRTLVRLEQLPQHVIDAVVAIEDRRFFRHNGVDMVSIGRALINNVRGDGLYQGASTITQQLVKNLYLSPEKTLKRKISEATMAVLMEAKYSKEEILEFYLNEVYLGQRGPVSIKGIGEASQLYFKKDARHLTIPEAAMIAGLIQAPSRYDPYKHPEKAKLRRNSVLMAMNEVGVLTPEKLEQYADSSLKVKEPDARLNRAPYFLTYVKKQLRDQFSKRALHQSDYSIISTLDYDMQIAAQEALSQGLARIDKIRGRRGNRQVQGSLIAIEASTGKIRAFVGGRNFAGSQFDRLTQAQRQPGSSFKPFVYAAALESAFESQDRFFTTSSLVADEPWSMQIDKAVWQPRNYNGGYNGVVSLRTALSKSMNIATAKVGEQIGFHKIHRLALNMGFNNVKPYPSITLGAFEVSPFQLIRAYTAFANGGKVVELQAISRVTDTTGDVVRKREFEQTQVLHPETAYLITDMLKTVMQSGTGASVQRWGIHRAMAGKTGTTNDQKDAWFVGYTPDFICLVWVGYDNNTPVRMTGAQAALPIWAQFMKSIESRIPNREFPRPAGVIERMIDPYTGKLASYSCPNAVRELFIKGTEPLRECTDSDHFLPIEYFLGPEPRIQHASYTDGYYTGYDYADISYDTDRYAYTNYEDDAYEPGYESPETIDYSDESFPEESADRQVLEQRQYQNSTDAFQNDGQSLTTNPEQTEQAPAVINDYEAEITEESDNEALEPKPTNAPVYLAPKPSNKKRIPVYTNKDIPESDRPSAESEEDDDDEQ